MSLLIFRFWAYNHFGREQALAVDQVAEVRRCSALAQEFLGWSANNQRRPGRGWGICLTFAFY